MQLNNIRAMRILLLFLGLSLTGVCSAQRGSTKADSAARVDSFYLSAMKSALDSGHYQRVLDLDEKYRHSGYYSLKSNDKIAELTLLLAERQADGYQEHEMDSLQKLIYILEPNKTAHVFGLGVEGGERISAIGKPGGAVGFTLQWNIQVQDFFAEYKEGVGVDIGLFKENFPFALDIIRNKGAANSYTPTGYLLNTTGNISFLGVPLRLAYNIRYPTSDNRVGVGFFTGIEWKHMTSVDIYQYYYEYNYRVQPYSGDSTTVTYSYTAASGYKDKSFFTKLNYLSLPIGAKIYALPLDHLLITLTGFYAFNLANSMRIAATGFPLKAEYSAIQLNVSYLFGKKYNASFR